MDKVCLRCGSAILVNPGEDILICFTDGSHYVGKPQEKEEKMYGQEGISESRAREIFTEMFAEAAKAFEAKMNETAVKAAADVRAYVDSFNLADQFQSHVDEIENLNLKIAAMIGDPIQVTKQEFNLRLADLLRTKPYVAELKPLVESAKKAAAEAKVRVDHEARISWIESRLGRGLNDAQGELPKTEAEAGASSPETPAEGGPK